MLEPPASRPTPRRPVTLLKHLGRSIAVTADVRGGWVDDRLWFRGEVDDGRFEATISPDEIRGTRWSNTL